MGNGAVERAGEMWDDARVVGSCEMGISRSFRVGLGSCWMRREAVKWDPAVVGCDR